MTLAVHGTGYRSIRVREGAGHNRPRPASFRRCARCWRDQRALLIKLWDLQKKADQQRILVLRMSGPMLTFAIYVKIGPCLAAFAIAISSTRISFGCPNTPRSEERRVGKACR